MKKPKQIASIEGWVLVAQDVMDDEPEWYIVWMDFFRSKKAAIEFAQSNNWPKPYKAVRGQMVALQ
jgi:hypothetical protein